MAGRSKGLWEEKDSGALGSEVQADCGMGYWREGTEELGLSAEARVSIWQKRRIPLHGT